MSTMSTVRSSKSKNSSLPMDSAFTIVKPRSRNAASIESLSGITRAEIESVRGVAVNPNITKTLLERQWIRVVGHRDLPGRPELLGTTREFQEYFGLRSLDELPPLTALQSLGELDPQLELSVAGSGVAGSDESAAAPGQPPAGELIDDEASDSDAAEAEEFDAAAQASAGLLAAPPDDR